MEENKALELTEVAVEEMVEYCEPRGKKGLAITLGAAAIAGVGLLAYKGRGKLTDMRVKRLEKKGYIVYAPDELEPAITEDCEPSETVEM